MSNADLETLAEQIKQHSADDFGQLPIAEVEAGSATATFRWYPSGSHPKALVKIFVGDDAGSLFRQEITALYMLRHTGRVCTVVCNSSKLQTRFWDEDSPGLYFIAKLYYPTSLESALRTTTALEKLDLAAQQVDIARLFLKLGWRDYDWRKANDVVDENGRVLRVDLDSASSLTGFFEQKSTIASDEFFSIAERKILVNFLTLRRDLLKAAQSNEVRNMAIRLSHSVFIDGNDKHELKNLIGELQDNASPALIPNDDGGITSVRQLSVGLTRRARVRVAAIVKWGTHAVLKPRSDGISQSHSSSIFSDPSRILVTRFREDTSAPERWIKLWERQANHGAPSPQLSVETLSQLTRNELGLIGRLFHHIISNLDHGFSLDDLHASLVMVSLAALRDRTSRLPRERWTSREAIERLSPNTRFFEVRNTLLHPNSGTARVTDIELKQSERSLIGDVRERRSRLRTQTHFVTKVESSHASAFWPAAKKALGRDCEDRAWTFWNGTFQIGTVIDGVSEASGLVAAVIAHEVTQTWASELRPSSPEILAGDIKDLLRKINALLLEKFKQTKRAHQAMMAIALVSMHKDSCFACIAKAGDDSDCVVFNPDGTFKYSTKNRKMGPRLGEVAVLKDDDIHVDRIVLNFDSTYRFRLFSDGIGSVGYDRVRKVERIGDLINEAQHWHEDFGDAVGFDDWSVAGFDLKAKQSERIEISDIQDPEALAEPENATSQSLFHAVSEFQPEAIQMSSEAREFWRQELDSLQFEESEQSKPVNDFIRKAVGVGRNSGTYEQLGRRPARVVNVEAPPTDFVRPRTLGILMTVLLIASLVVLWYFIPRRAVSPEEQQNSSASHSPSSSQSSSDTTFANARQRLIFQHLNSRPMIHIEPNLPAGVEIEDSRMREFLTDLKQVLRGSDFSVKIEIYAAPGGDRRINMNRTIQRAKLVEQELLNDGIPAKQLQVEGKGLPNRRDIPGATFEISRRTP